MSNEEKYEKDSQEFIKEYLSDPVVDYTKEQIVDSLQEYLVEKGYGIDQFNATVEYVTGGGKGVNFNGFLETESNSKFAAKLASLDVAKFYAYCTTISGFAKPVSDLYNNLSQLENYKNEDGSYTYEGNQLLEDSLYEFIKISAKSADLIPGGFVFSTLANEIIPIIGDGITTIKGEISSEKISMFCAMGNGTNYFDDKMQALINGTWENGPSVEELENIYNNCTGTEIFDEYLEWRIQYEFENKLKEQGIDVEDYYDKMKPSTWDIIKYYWNDFWGKDEEIITDEITPVSNKVKSKYLDNVKTKTLTASKTTYDPIILDLDGDGFNIETKENGTNFDLDKNGFAEKINWTSKDGFLCLDLNGNGAIDDGGELFGDQTLLADGTKAKNGFEALAQYDSNSDGVIDENDEIYGSLRVWVDADGNGTSGEGELKTLADLGITSISLGYENVNAETGTEATIGNTATFTYADGTTGSAGELWVSSDLFDTVDNLDIEIPDDIKELPNVSSIGNVYSLHNAM